MRFTIFTEESAVFDASSFGERLKQHRVGKHLTQAQLAELIDTNTSSISHLENGTHKPSLNTLITLCNVLDIGVDDLLADSLPMKDIYLDHDIQSLLSDCSEKEKRVIKDMIASLKKSMRKHEIE